MLIFYRYQLSAISHQLSKHDEHIPRDTVH